MIAGAARSLSRAAALTVALATAAAAWAEPLEVSVGCRDGAPNGAYELRDANGRLRVVGALAKGHRTGTFIFWNASGARIGVIPYDSDEKVGTVALWYAPRGSSAEGGRKLEAPYAGARRHGVTRSWHDNGRPRAELNYERGTLVEARAWQRNGTELAQRDATALAERDAVADEAALTALEAIVASHLPACESSTPSGQTERCVEPPRCGDSRLLVRARRFAPGADLASHAPGLHDVGDSRPFSGRPRTGDSRLLAARFAGPRSPLTPLL